MRTLVVLDVDGTLLHSVAPHQSAFLAALRDLGLTEIDAARGGYTHHTDSWIFREVFRANTGRLPGDPEVQRFADGDGLWDVARRWPQAASASAAHRRRSARGSRRARCSPRSPTST
ncbi:hypothetical protein [Actinokineospora globicatena]|uniref:hypothetical protein n=1 Tax=Actinokineospora globicatena TaxID=103729 RepID=UPI0020A5BE49|nr:hypothetical protein [Actinokineospora globicatena]MCP2304141.1 hypothetical protein [Actinokineospora globicatena]